MNILVILLIDITTAIIVNFPIIKRKLHRKTIYLLEIYASILGLIMMVDGAIIMFLIGTNPLQVKMLPIWMAMVVLIMAIVVDCYKYQKIKKKMLIKIWRNM